MSEHNSSCSERTDMFSMGYWLGWEFFYLALFFFFSFFRFIISLSLFLTPFVSTFLFFFLSLHKCFSRLLTLSRSFSFTMCLSPFPYSPLFTHSILFFSPASYLCRRFQFQTSKNSNLIFRHRAINHPWIYSTNNKLFYQNLDFRAERVPYQISVDWVVRAHAVNLPQLRPGFKRTFVFLFLFSSL